MKGKRWHPILDFLVKTENGSSCRESGSKGYTLERANETRVTGANSEEESRCNSVTGG